MTVRKPLGAGPSRAPRLVDGDDFTARGAAVLQRGPAPLEEQRATVRDAARRYADGDAEIFADLVGALLGEHPDGRQRRGRRPGNSIKSIRQADGRRDEDDPA